MLVESSPMGAWGTGSLVPAGGTADQVLSKVDGTDGNVQWVTRTGLSHHGPADPVDTFGNDGDFYYTIDLTSKDNEIKASFVKDSGAWVKLVSETPKPVTRVLFTPKAGAVTAAHNGFITTLILGSADAGGLLSKVSGKENTIFLEDADGNESTL